MAQPLFQIHRNAIAKGTLHQKRSTKTQATFSDKASRVLVPSNAPQENPIDDKEIAKFLEQIDETKADSLLSTVWNLVVNPNSYWRFFSGNESVDVRFVPDVLNNKGEPYMGFGNSPEEAKKDLLQLLLKSGRIIIPE